MQLFYHILELISVQHRLSETLLYQHLTLESMHLDLSFKDIVLLFIYPRPF